MSIGNSSSLPISMAKDRKILITGENMANDPVGPTSSRPGPMFDIHATTAVNEVTGSNPSQLTITVMSAVMMRYAKLKISDPRTAVLSTTEPSSLTD